MALHAHGLAAGLAVLPEDSLPEVVKGNECWDLLPTTVRVFDDVFPLQMGPVREGDSERFETFVQQVMDPLLTGPLEIQAEGLEEEYEVEKVLAHRKRKGKLQFKVKYKGWQHKYNRWLDKGVQLHKGVQSGL